jgi:tRNA modification GTPase
LTIQLDDTIAAIATAPGEGAIGIVRLSGPQALPIARSLFRPARRRGADQAAAAALPAMGRAERAPSSIRRWRSHHLYHGHVIDPRTGVVVDEVLAVYMRGPRSYTGQDVVEISSHGGRVSVQEVLRLAADAGARLAERGELTLRAYLAGKLDLAQAEAVADAVRARTPGALSLAVRQLGGGLSAAVRCVRQPLLDIYAHLEATLDFAEDDVPPPADDDVLAVLRNATRALDTLLSTARAGQLHRDGLRVALVGRPNVGKSSLLNALLDSERAIVTPIAGTTRDVIEETIDLGGIPATIADTAGITRTEDTVERLGVERSRAALAAADVVVCLVDGSEPLGDADHEVAALVAARRAGGGLDGDEQGAPGGGGASGAAGGPVGAGAVVVLSKADLPRRVGESEAGALLPGAPVIRISSRTGEGLETLRQGVRQAGLGAAVLGEREAEAIVSSARHRAALNRAQAALAEAIQSVESGMMADMVCIDLRASIAALGEITGESVTEDLLTVIFSQFCIGK